ncbi:hypothetical protein HUG20_09330 [Salicibibacter cibi]|uniref:Uncharacterized protein n=1 Tax=Salicibibacter cibi TaxID=2743001 RepID=A0A7T7CFJ9_9BACI|nr:hypothetical protein [Salicibibacter cibi]QQK80069.1 hypothetical protein HUG20_09330 [Salicibibacter cibi]
MHGNPSYKQKTLALLATYGGMTLQWRRHKTDASSPLAQNRRCGGLTRPRKGEAMGSGIPASADSCKLFSNPYYIKLIYKLKQ